MTVRPPAGVSSGTLVGERERVTGVWLAVSVMASLGHVRSTVCVMCDTGHVCFAQAMFRYEVIGLESLCAAAVLVRVRFWSVPIMEMRSSVRVSVEDIIDVE